MAIITGTNLSDVLIDTDEPVFARIAPASTPGAKAAPGGTVPSTGSLSYDDTINALDGSDRITIRAGNDTVNGGNGGDTVYDSGSGNDTFDGGADNDTFFVGLGNDAFNGGSGIDTVSYANRDALVSLNLTDGHALAEGIDTLVSVENAVGSRYDDFLVGNGAANGLHGGDGGDSLDGEYGNDYLAGNAGNDTLTGARGRDTLRGGEGDDTLYGASEDQPDEGRPGDTNNRDTLAGETGDDVMDGGDGDDRLLGGAGNDIMTGGDDADTFHISAGDIDDFDTITDFQHGVDKIDLSGIDARPDLAGNQAFTFDASPDGWTEERLDGLDDSGAWLIGGTGPTINGDTGEIEYRHEDDKTYVYLSYADHPNGASIVLDGTVNITASDFIL